MYVQTEVSKHKGHLDLMAATEGFLYLMEFKLDGNTNDALTQIKDREYAAAYVNSPKEVYLLDINFSKEERNISNWEAEVWERN